MSATAKQLVHLATGSSTVRCGGKVSPWYDRATKTWHYDGIDLGGMTVEFWKVTCPGCRAGWGS